jgi:hypothetical protein
MRNIAHTNSKDTKYVLRPVIVIVESGLSAESAKKKKKKKKKSEKAQQIENKSIKKIL